MSDLIRRDPRTEWITRNRLHPLHADVLFSGGGATGAVRGPSGLIRKNPHASGFIGPNGIKRIDRLAALKGESGPVAGQRRGAAKAATEVQLPLVTVENPDFYIVAVLDMVGGRLTSHDKDVLGQGHKLAAGLKANGEGEGVVVAVAFGEVKETSFDTAGADRVIHLQGEQFEGYSPEQRITALQVIDQQLAPRHWLFPDSVAAGQELGCRLAARLGERPATQAWQVDNDSALCRGGSQRIDISRATPRLLLLAEECADPIDETRHEAKLIELDNVPATLSRIQDCGAVDVDPSQIPLGEAEFILSAGNGIHDWNQFHAAAEVLGATEGASRVAVDDGFMPRFRQVGATGTWVTARVYVAVGISGAIQHMQGIGQCDKVVAINTDAGCDMVKRADLSVIGDSGEILAELIRLVESRQQGGAEDAA